MKKITLALIMLFTVLFSINVKAGDIYDITPTIEKDRDGELYNLMPTLVEKGEVISVKFKITDVEGWEIGYGVNELSWDKEAFELVEQSDGKYFIAKDSHLDELSLQVSEGLNKATLYYSYNDSTFETNESYVAEIQFRTKKNVKDGVYHITLEHSYESTLIDMPNDYEYISTFEKKLKYQVGKPRITSRFTRDDITNSSYVIGGYLFTRDGSDEYDGTLTTEHIMLSSKSIQENELDKMVIYVKNARGKWKNAISDREFGVDLPIENLPESFDINYIDMVAHYAEDGIYTDDNENTILRIVQFNDKEAIVTIETDSEVVHGIANINNRVATFTISGINYKVTFSDDAANIETSDSYIIAKALTKRANISVNEYLNNNYVNGVYDGGGGASYYINSNETGKFIYGDYELDVLRVDENSLRICLKENGQSNCIIDEYANAVTDIGRDTYSIRLEEAEYGFKWSNNGFQVLCEDGTCNDAYIGTYTKEKGFSIEDVFHLWEKNEIKYKVIYDAVSDDDNTYIYVPKGKSIIGANEYINYPYKEGYVFMEWQLNSQPYDFNTPVNAPITLTATYKQLPGAPTLAIVPQSEEIDYISYSSDTETFEYKLSITLDGEYDGYDIFCEFGTGCSNSDPIANALKGENATVEVPANDIKKYYAKAYILNEDGKNYGTASNLMEISPTTFNVEFLPYVGAPYSSVTVPHGAFVEQPEDPTRNFFTFNGWLNGDQPFDFANTRINSSILLKGSWEENIPTPVIGVRSTNLYNYYIYIANSDDYCVNSEGECTNEEDYGGIKYKLYKVISGEYEEVSSSYTYSPNNQRYITLNANTITKYAIRAYLVDSITSDVTYSDYSEVYEIDTTLPTPTIAFNPTFGTPNLSSYESENWIQITNLNAFSYQDSGTYYNLNGFKLYNKVGSEYVEVRTFTPVEVSLQAIEVNANYGEEYHYYVRGYVTQSGNTIYTPYSNELVYNPEIPAPVISRTLMESSNDYRLLEYNDTKGFGVALGANYSIHSLCDLTDPENPTNCRDTVDEYEWFDKVGTTLTSVHDGGMGGEVTLYVPESNSKTFVAKAYVNRSGNTKYYGPESNQIAIDLSNPTYTFETEDVAGDSTKVLVKGYINNYGIAFNTINNGTSDITDDGTASYFVTDKSNLENIDTITIKLSSSKTVTATRQTN